ERLMRRALELAEQGRGLTSPNPMVGAVVAAPSGEIVGEGVHWRDGEPHAEITALRAAGARARGATHYVTLEPCAHHGRTPPCARAVVEAGVARVVVPLADPNPLVAGRGFDALRGAGLEVSVGLLAEEAARQNRVFFTAMRERRPHVTLKAAMTLDGKIADTHGTARWITGERARAHAHRLRSEAQGVLVEGGGEVHAAFLDAGIVDRVAVFVAPLLVGGRTAPSVVGGAGRELKSGVRLGPLIVTPIGDDILVEADVIP